MRTITRTIQLLAYGGRMAPIKASKTTRGHGSSAKFVTVI